MFTVFTIVVSHTASVQTAKVKDIEVYIKMNSTNKGLVLVSFIVSLLLVLSIVLYLSCQPAHWITTAPHKILTNNIWNALSPLGSALFINSIFILQLNCKRFENTHFHVSSISIFYILFLHIPRFLPHTSSPNRIS